MSENNYLEEDEENEEDASFEADSATVLSMLDKAWLNEKFSPELLPCKSDVVEAVMEQLQSMQRNIDSAKKGDFKVGIHKLELDRIRYVLSNYLRARLRKIETFSQHILEKAKADTNLLTPEEHRFASEFQASIETHFHSLALRHLPHSLQALDPKQTSVRPNLDSYVFLKVEADVEGVAIEDDTDNSQDVLDLVTGDQHLMCYRYVADLVVKEKVSLI